MPTKSELLRDASAELCRYANIERTEAKQVCAAAKEARAFVSTTAPQDKGGRRISKGRRASDFFIK